MFFRELRCPKCRALISKEYVLLGRESYKCSRCKFEFNQFYFVPKRILERLIKMSDKEYKDFFKKDNLDL